MAWIHKKSCEVLHAIPDGLKECDFFHVDDMIAVPVAKLNKIGLTTKESCAGHPFPIAHLLDTAIDIQNPLDMDELAQSVKAEPATETVRFVLRTYKMKFSYIEFKDPLPDHLDVPEGWHYDEDGQMLYTRYRKNDSPHAFFEEQFEKVESLMSWADDIQI